MTVSACLAISCTRSVNKAPALFKELREVERHIKSTIECIITAPRLFCRDKLFLAVGHTVIICTDYRLKFVQRHISAGEHCDDAVCYIEHSVNIGKTAFAAVIIICTVAVAHRRAALAEPYLFSVVCGKLLDFVICPVAVVAADYINRIQQFLIFQHYCADEPRAYFVCGNDLNFGIIIRAVSFTFEM